MGAARGMPEHGILEKHSRNGDANFTASHASLGAAHSNEHSRLAAPVACASKDRRLATFLSQKQDAGSEKAAELDVPRLRSRL